MNLTLEYSNVQFLDIHLLFEVIVDLDYFVFIGKFSAECFLCIIEFLIVLVVQHCAFVDLTLIHPILVKFIIVIERSCISLMA